MLIQENQILNLSPILEVISCGKPSRELQTGIYEIGHFGMSNWPFGYERGTKLSIAPYGVCDTVDQILAACPELQADLKRQFVITVTPVVKNEQPSEGGWRWHKWGPYIGTKTPKQEYLIDEEDIDSVLVYHIYEKETHQEN